jgi:hypothetical protein
MVCSRPASHYREYKIARKISRFYDLSSVNLEQIQTLTRDDPKINRNQRQIRRSCPIISLGAFTSSIPSSVGATSASVPPSFNRPLNFGS